MEKYDLRIENTFYNPVNCHRFRTSVSDNDKVDISNLAIVCESGGVPAISNFWQIKESIFYYIVFFPICRIKNNFLILVSSFTRGQHVYKIKWGNKRVKRMFSW